MKAKTINRYWPEFKEYVRNVRGIYYLTNITPYSMTLWYEFLEYRSAQGKTDIGKVQASKLGGKAV